MVDNTRIKDWLSRNIRHLDITFTELEWTNKYKINIYDYACDLTIKNVVHHGRGSSHNRDEAIIKSFVESCERLSLKLNNLNNSNGVAFHQNEDLASNAALNELIERDAFFCHYLTQTPFVTIPDKIIQSSRISIWSNQFSSAGVEFIFAEMCSPKGRHCIITAAFGWNCSDPWGLIFGTACSKDPVIALEKSFIEASRAIAEKIETGLPIGQDTNSFLGKTNFRIMDHYQLSLDVLYSKEFKKTYFQNEFKSAIPSDLGSISLERLKTPTENLFELPLVGVRAYSKKIQSAFFGITKSEEVNWLRLQEFSGNSFHLQMLPHPFR